MPLAVLHLRTLRRLLIALSNHVQVVQLVDSMSRLNLGRWFLSVSLGLDFQVSALGMCLIFTLIRRLVEQKEQLIFLGSYYSTSLWGYGGRAGWSPDDHSPAAISSWEFTPYFSPMDSQKYLESQVSAFNVEHPVGSTVTLTSAYGPSMTTTVRAPASIVCGSAVGWLDGVPGCMDLDLIS